MNSLAPRRLDFPRVRTRLHSLRQIPNAAFVALLLFSLLLFESPVREIISQAFRDDRYLQAAVAPILCFFLMFWERARIFLETRFSPRFGLPLVLLILLGLVLLRRHASANASTSFLAEMLVIVLVWIAVFILCYGTASFRAGIFPLCCLFLMVPPPVALMDRLTLGLQHGSADVSYLLFKLAGIPVFRSGMTFSLPGLNIEVAPECSGIHAFLVLVIGAILAGRVFLSTGWSRLVLIIMTVPIAIIKNAVRIVVIATLSAYVNRAFLFGNLHHYGGLVFAIVGIGLFLPLLAALRKSEIHFLPRDSARRGVATP